jgi:hypothetical protein
MRSRRGTRRLGDSLGGKPVMPSHGAQFDEAPAGNIDGRAPRRSKARRPSVRARSDARSYASGERP